MNTLAFTVLLTGFCLKHVYGHNYVGPAIADLTINSRGYPFQHPYANGVVRTPFDRWLTKRQANEEPTTMLTEREQRVCTAKFNDIFCSYIQQGLTDVLLSCGASTDSVRQTANRKCGRNERGVLCQTVFQQLYFDSEIFSNIAGNCSTFGVVNTSSPCSSQCSALLEDFKRTAGCCIGNYVNDTIALTIEYGTMVYYATMVAFDYRVWNWCGISLPPTTCETGLTINPPAGVRDSCTISELIARTYPQHICLPDIGQPFIDVLQSDDDCYQINNHMAQSYVSYCSRNSDGRYCISLIADQPTISQDQSTRLNNSCASSKISCNQTCRNGIIEAKKVLECCVNLFNTSVTVTSPVLSHTVWKNCGVESPGFCHDSTLKLNNGATTSFTGKNAWMLTFFLLLPVHLVVITTL